MKEKIKMIVGIALVLGIVSIALLATPIQAYVNGTGDSDMPQTQERDKLRTRDCDGDMLQRRTKDRLRTQNRCCNCTANLEQYRYQYRNQEQANNIVP